MKSDLGTIPLTLSTHIAAQEFSRQQSHPEKAKQVYQNTLAVLAVNTYLQYLGWTTSLESSDSWHPSMQTLLDTADLKLLGYGSLECRPVIFEDRVMAIPEEVNSNRIAYIAVNIEKSQKSAQLLGFVSQVSSSTISLNCLQPIAELSGYLEQYHHNLERKRQSLPQLSNWLSGIIEAGWQTLDRVLCPQSDVVFRVVSAHSNFRTGMMSPTSPSVPETGTTTNKRISRVKIWDLETGEQNIRIALIINLLSKDGKELEISVKVCPTDENTYLPQGLVMQILDETKQAILQAQTKATNENIEFFLSGEIGEVFSIQAILKDQTKIESFII